MPAIHVDAAPRPGEVIGGKYRVERPIGSGGMALVVEATHVQLDERVALKFLNREALKSPDLVSRFEKEARATAKLKSEYVGKVFDVGTREDGSPYNVMEYLEGRDLAAEIAKVGAIPLPEAVEYVIQACEAISEAHSRGIVHRDIKPENLFLVDRPGGRFVKVLDFGISKIALTGKTSSVDLDQTGTQRVMGSPYYMSPEQLRSSRSVDFRSDIWSVGAVLFELLTGVRAFADADDFSALVIAIVQDRHRSLLDYLPSVPSGMVEIVDRCLSKARAERFESAAELAIALLPYAPSRARGTVERAVATYESTGTSPRLVVPSIPPPTQSGAHRKRERHETSSGVAGEQRQPVGCASRRGRNPRALPRADVRAHRRRRDRRRRLHIHGPSRQDRADHGVATRADGHGPRGAGGDRPRKRHGADRNQRRASGGAHLHRRRGGRGQSVHRGPSPRWSEPLRSRRGPRLRDEDAHVRRERRRHDRRLPRPRAARERRGTETPDRTPAGARHAPPHLCRRRRSPAPPIPAPPVAAPPVATSPVAPGAPRIDGEAPGDRRNRSLREVKSSRPRQRRRGACGTIPPARVTFRDAAARLGSGRGFVTTRD